jgi:hypothetical protein
VTTLANSETGELKAPLPAWIKASLEVKEGRDPLGLLTTTQDRLMPTLLPGILELSRGTHTAAVRVGESSDPTGLAQVSAALRRVQSGRFMAEGT